MYINVRPGAHKIKSSLEVSSAKHRREVVGKQTFFCKISALTRTRVR